MTKGSVRRLPIIAVIGSGSKEHEALAAPVGRWVARRGCHLLTGGGGGVMRAVSRAFCGEDGRAGMALGILPADPEAADLRPRSGYPNEWVEIAIRTHLPLSGTRGTEPLSRNHLNVLSADLIVALPGGAGTTSEVRLALRYGRPVVALLSERTDIPELPDEVPLVTTVAHLEQHMEDRIGF